MKTSEGLCVDITKRRKAMITIRYIPSDSSYNSENEQFGSIFSCTVQPNEKNNFTLPEVVKCSSNQIVYHEQVSSQQTRVTGLHFLLMGHDIDRDFSAYSCCVRSIEFHGHLSYTRPAFHIISQLKSLEKVNFAIGGPSQLPLFYESKTESMGNIAQNTNAKYLTIRVDIRNYKVSSTVTKKAFHDLASSVLARSGHCLPNLENVYVEFPCTGQLAKLTEETIETKWKSLSGKLMTSYCPFAEALFVVPLRKVEPGCEDSINDLDLELLDILIGRPYTSQSSHPYGVPNPFYNPDLRNPGSAVYYGRNYARFFPIERPRAPANFAVPVRNDPNEDRARQERILQILRQQNILGVNNNNNHIGVGNQNAVQMPRPDPARLPDNVYNFNLNPPHQPRRRLPHNHPNYRPYPYDEDENDDIV